MVLEKFEKKIKSYEKKVSTQLNQEKQKQAAFIIPLLCIVVIALGIYIYLAFFS